jgi:hypothetical protein
MINNAEQHNTNDITKEQARRTSTAELTEQVHVIQQPRRTSIAVQQHTRRTFCSTEDLISDRVKINAHPEEQTAKCGNECVGTFCRAGISCGLA